MTWTIPSKSWRIRNDHRNPTACHLAVNGGKAGGMEESDAEVLPIYSIIIYIYIKIEREGDILDGQHLQTRIDEPCNSPYMGHGS